MKNRSSIPIKFINFINKALSEESDRACVILFISWVDTFLKTKLAREFSKGNSKARDALFSSNGPFSTFSAKLNTAFCAGWVDKDVYNDLQTIKKIRNTLAHSIESHTLNDEPFPKMIDKLQVPNRQYYDWGKIRAAKTVTGMVLYTGERPTVAQENLDISNHTFRVSASIIATVLCANLKIPVDIGSSEEMYMIELPDFMRKISE